MALTLAERWGRPLTELLDVPAPVLELQYRYIVELSNPNTEVIKEGEELDPVADFTPDEMEVLNAASNIAKQYG